MSLDDFLMQLNNTPTATAPTTPSLSPVDLALPLLPYQEEARDFVLTRNSSYLALDMGLGKTAVGISVAAAAKQAGQTPVVIVVPPSLRRNWAREFKKFAPWLKGTIIEGNNAKDIPNMFDVLIIGDSTLVAWEEPIKKVIKTLIVDEAHRHKNFASKRAKAMASIAEACSGIRVLMSGTPIPNGRNSEMAGQLEILGKEAWAAVGGKGKFWNYYCPKINTWGTRGSADNLGLHEDMKSFMMRRRRDEVLTLPNKGRTLIAIEGSGKAASDYPLIEDDLISYLKNEGFDSSGAARAETLVRLGLLRRTAGLAKAPGVVDHVDELLDSPGGVFVVAENSAVITHIHHGLLDHGCAVIQGGMSDREKMEAVDAFNSGKARVLIGQITAAGVGLTLHGDGLNHRVVVAQLPWTPAELRQAEDRLHRMGQTHDVQVEVTACSIEGRWTIDERLWNVLEQKAFSTGETIDGEGEFLLDEVQGGVIDSYR